jgi:hypothetical protein
MKHTIFILTIFLCALIPGLPGTVAAQNPSSQSAQSSDLLPVKSAEEANVTLDEANPTHPAIKMSPDKSELIRLDRKAASVLLGNPAHLSILPEGSNTLVLVPKAPGATYFTVLDEDDKVIMQRHVIVAAPSEKYVRIRKSCVTGKDCQATQVYYCPDMCHEIIMNGTEANKSSQDSEGAVSAGSSNAATEPAKDEVAKTGNNAPDDDGDENTEE